MTHNLTLLKNNAQLTNKRYKFSFKKTTCKELTTEFFSLIQNQNIDPAERTSQLKDLERRVTKLRSSTQKSTLLRKLHKELFNLKNLQTQGILEILRERALFYSNQEKNQKTLFQHLALDSLAMEFPQLVRNNGITDIDSLAFIGSILRDFAASRKQDDREVLLNLAKSIKTALDIELILRSPGRFPNTQITLSKLISKRLVKMASGQCTRPLLINAGSNDHAVALKISFSEKNQFNLTVINTGHRAEFDEEAGMYTDLHFSNLTLQDLEDLPWIVLHRPKNYSFFIYSLKRALNHPPVEYASYHGRQKGDSCTSKILTQFLKTSMPPLLYRKFKVFMTIKLLETQNDDQLKKLGAIILQKRQLKSLFPRLERIRTKLKAKKENQTPYDKTFPKLRSLFEEIRLPYQEKHTSSENILDAKRWIYGQLSALSEKDQLEKALNTV